MSNAFFASSESAGARLPRACVGSMLNLPIPGRSTGEALAVRLSCTFEMIALLTALWCQRDTKTEQLEDTQRGDKPHHNEGVDSGHIGVEADVDTNHVD